MYTDVCQQKHTSYCSANIQVSLDLVFSSYAVLIIPVGSAMETGSNQ